MESHKIHVPNHQPANYVYNVVICFVWKWWNQQASGWRNSICPLLELHALACHSCAEWRWIQWFVELWKALASHGKPLENLWTFGKPLECVNPYKVTRHAQRFSTAKLGNISNTFKYQPYQHIHERHGRWMSVNIGKAHASRILWALPRIYWLDDPLLLW